MLFLLQGQFLPGVAEVACGGKPDFQVEPAIMYQDRKQKQP